MVVGKDENQNAVKNEESVHTAGGALPEFAKRVVQDAARDVVYGAAVVDEGGSDLCNAGYTGTLNKVGQLNCQELSQEPQA